MIAGRSVLALITARGGSKGLPGKNLLPVNGRPLLAWTVDAARRSAYVDRVVLSSDDEIIAAAALACGCEVPFRRPDELASDTAATIDVALHALAELPGHDWLVLLQPTSPLRTAADIDAALERCVATGARSCVSVTAVEQSPYWMYRIGDNDRLNPIMEALPAASRRQDLPAVYALNGAVYVADTGELKRTRSFINTDTVAYVMPAERSIDIDTAADFESFRLAVCARPTIADSVAEPAHPIASTQPTP
jgi:CMP-N,N'-diacetyllegionaminic acid synthase